MAPYCVVQIHYEMRKTSQSMPITLNGPHSNRKCRLTENPNKVALSFQTPQTLHRTVNTLSFHHSAKNTTSQPPLTPPCTQPNIHSWTQTHNSSDTLRHSTSQYTVIPSLSQEHNQPARVPTPFGWWNSWTFPGLFLDLILFFKDPPGLKQQLTRINILSQVTDFHCCYINRANNDSMALTKKY